MSTQMLEAATASRS